MEYKSIRMGCQGLLIDFLNSSSVYLSRQYEVLIINVQLLTEQFTTVCHMLRIITRVMGDVKSIVRRKGIYGLTLCGESNNIRRNIIVHRNHAYRHAIAST